MREERAAGRHRRQHRRRPWVWAAGLALALLATWVLLGWQPIVSPAVDNVQPVDAVFVIGPAETRMPQALRHADDADASLLLSTISVDPRTGQAYPRDYCEAEGEGYHVECVIPQPYTTRGEARLLGDQVQQHGWSRVAVVTSTPHAARTRLLMERCTDADVLVWTVDDERSKVGWVRQFAYQSAAWVKTQVQREC